MEFIGYTSDHRLMPFEWSRRIYGRSFFRHPVIWKTKKQAEEMKTGKVYQVKITVEKYPMEF